MAVLVGKTLALISIWALSMQGVCAIRERAFQLAEALRAQQADLEDEQTVVNTSSIVEPSDEEAFQLAEKAMHASGLTFLNLKKKIGQGTAGTIYVATVMQAPTAAEKEKLIIEEKLLTGSVDFLTEKKDVVVKDSIIGEEECKPTRCELTRTRSPCAEARKERMFYMKLMNHSGYHNSIARPYAFAEACDGYKRTPETPEPAGRAHHFFVMDFLRQPSTFEDCLTGINVDCKRMNASTAAVEDVVRVWFELVDGYKYLCNAGIVQRDGWKENRILAKDDQDVWHVKIVDFGKGVDDAEECGKDLQTLLNTANAITEKHSGWTERHTALKSLNDVLQCKVHIPEKRSLLGRLFGPKRKTGCASAEHPIDFRGNFQASHVEAMEIYDSLLAALKKK